VAAHDFSQLCFIWWSADCRVHHCGDLAEILRTNGSRSDHTQDLYIPAPVVVETVNGAARDAECLSRANIDFLCAKRPARHSFNTKNGFFVMVMAMCRRIQTVSEWDNELKG